MNGATIHPEMWLDSHLSRKIAKWIREDLGVPCRHISDIGRREEGDVEFFHAARAAGVILITKDDDLPRLLRELGPPPKIIWLTCGNTSNTVLRRLFATRLNAALDTLAGAESLVQLDLPPDWARR